MDFNGFNGRHKVGVEIDCAYSSIMFSEINTDPDECKKVLIADIPGISADKVNVCTKWHNRLKELYFVITIDVGNDHFRKENYYVDTTIYDKYSWEVTDGRLTITLYEIINEQPKFELI